jgi:hypothetical protein
MGLGQDGLKILGLRCGNPPPPPIGQGEGGGGGGRGGMEHAHQDYKPKKSSCCIPQAEPNFIMLPCFHG